MFYHGPFLIALIAEVYCFDQPLLGLTIGDYILSDTQWRAKVLRLCWMWRDVGANSLKEMKCKDLISVVPWFKGEPISYACRVNKRLTTEVE